jgi:excinuclease UvrABC helicase subunit UvrB
LETSKAEIRERQQQIHRVSEKIRQLEEEKRRVIVTEEGRKFLNELSSSWLKVIERMIVHCGAYEEFDGMEFSVDEILQKRQKQTRKGGIRISSTCFLCLGRKKGSRIMR